MKLNKNYILTANDLIDGDVIYWGNNDFWVRHLNEAKVFEEKESANQALQAASTNIALVGSYLLEITKGDLGEESIHFREKFRANGPSNYHHGKQELGATNV